MRHKVFDDLVRAILDIHIPPVYPTMFGLQRSREQIVPGLAHGLPSGPLGLEPMPILYFLAERDAEVLLHDDRTVERDLVRPRLHPFQFHGQDRQGVVRAVTDQERQVDKVVGVCELGEEVEMLLDVGGGIAERGEDEDALLVRERFGGGGDGVEVDAPDAGVVDLDRRMVVEHDGRLEVAGP